MSQSVTINSVSYAFPDVDEEDWGQTVTDWAVAVSNSLLQKTGGAFTLSAEVDFGASWGVKSLYISSRTVGVASAGAVRLAKTDGVYWRNNVGGADLSLGIGSDDRIEFNSVELVNLDAAQTLENKTLTSPSISGATLSGFATDRALKTDGSGNIVVSDVLAAEIDLLDGSVANSVVNSKAAIYGSSGELAGTLSTAAQANITSLGTLSGLTVSSAISGSITGNSATATKLAAAVNVGGTTFDGSVSIAVALAATATKLAAPVSIGMTGDVVWSIATFDGSGNVTSGATLAATQTSIQSAANLTTVGALDAGSISSGFGAIDNGTSGIKSDVVTATTNIELDHQASDPSAPGGANDVIVYAKSKKVYTRDGAGTVTELGAGGGVGSIDTLFTIQAKSAETASDASGDDATWRGATATITGTLSQSETAADLIHDEKVFKYASTSGSENDWWCYTKAVPQGYQNRNLVLQFQYYHNANVSAGDFLVVIKDVTNGDILTDSLDQLPLNESSNAEAKTYRKQVLVPTGCDSLEIGFHYLGTATDAVLCYDDIALSANQFLQVSTQAKTASASWMQQGQYLSNGAGEVQFNLSSNITTTETDPAFGTYIVATNDSANNRTKWIAQRQVEVDIQYYGAGSDNYVEPAIGINGVAVFGGTNFYQMFVSHTTTLNKGDYLTVGVGINNEAVAFSTSASVNTSSTWANEQRVNITATPTANDCVLLNSSESIFTDWADYTPVWSVDGGTYTDNTEPSAFLFKSYKWRRNGSNMEITATVQYNAVGANGTGSVYTLEIPSGYAVDTTHVHASATVDLGSQVGTLLWNTNADMWLGGRVKVYDSTHLAFAWGASGEQTSYRWVDPSYGFGGSSGNWSLSFQAVVPIAGWNSSFNPVLSMPLVDFGTFENTYSAILANPSGTASITSQCGNFISSVTHLNVNGDITITWTPGMFSVAPAVVVCPQAAGNVFAAVSAVSTTGCTINADSDGGSNPDSGMNIVVTRQGADYRQPPQATAAVIKPAVCVLQDRKPYQTLGGNTTGGGTENNAWQTRDLNTVLGESWFVSGAFDGLNGTNESFELEAGMYEADIWQRVYQGSYSACRLYNETDNIELLHGMPFYGSSSSFEALLFIKGTFTITKTTECKVQLRTSTSITHGLGQYNYYSADQDSIFTQAIIKKLK
jgi:hypothetical protein